MEIIKSGNKSDECFGVFRNASCDDDGQAIELLAAMYKSGRSINGIYLQEQLHKKETGKVLFVRIYFAEAIDRSLPCGCRAEDGCQCY